MKKVIRCKYFGTETPEQLTMRLSLEAFGFWQNIEKKLLHTYIYIYIYIYICIYFLFTIKICKGNKHQTSVFVFVLFLVLHLQQQPDPVNSRRKQLICFCHQWFSLLLNCVECARMTTVLALFIVLESLQFVLWSQEQSAHCVDTFASWAVTTVLVNHAFCWGILSRLQVSNRWRLICGISLWSICLGRTPVWGAALVCLGRALVWGSSMVCLGKALVWGASLVCLGRAPVWGASLVWLGRAPVWEASLVCLVRAPVWGAALVYLGRAPVWGAALVCLGRAPVWGSSLVCLGRAPVWGSSLVCLGRVLVWGASLVPWGTGLCVCVWGGGCWTQLSVWQGLVWWSPAGPVSLSCWCVFVLGGMVWRSPLDPSLWGAPV